jgi:biofilm PGA synthesis N-glycosyltransferase PgaC
MTENMNPDSYVLVTAAYNEERFIEQTIRSIVSQTIRPAKWVVVSDGSTDSTDDIVKDYATNNAFIQLCRITDDHPRNFEAQAHAINYGLSQLRDVNYSFVGNLDADITLAPEYFALLLEKFHRDPRLGLGGGAICERCPDGKFRLRKMGSATSVAHACQLFRHDCFEAIGGAYLPLRYGGPDAHAETVARMKNWRVASFADLEVFHHRPTNSAEGALRGCFRQGKMDYSLGALPFFELFKLLRRVWVKPYLTGAMARCAGFVHSYCHRENREVPNDFVVYTRQEQKQKIINLFWPPSNKDVCERECPPPGT